MKQAIKILRMATTTMATQTTTTTMATPTSTTIMATN
jgi:hypothetical protein